MTCTRNSQDAEIKCVWFDQAATEIVLGDHFKSSGSASRTKLPSPTNARDALGILGGPRAKDAISAAGGF